MVNVNPVTFGEVPVTAETLYVVPVVYPVIVPVVVYVRPVSVPAVVTSAVLD